MIRRVFSYTELIRLDDSRPLAPLGGLETSSSGLAKSTGYERPSQNLRKEDSRLANERAFSSLLAACISESIADALGNDVLSILVSKGLLDNAENPRELAGQLSSIFGNGSKVLERIIVKGLYQRLKIPFDSNLGFDYGNALEVARDAHILEMRRR